MSAILYSSSQISNYKITGLWFLIKCVVPNNMSAIVFDEIVTDQKFGKITGFWFSIKCATILYANTWLIENLRCKTSSISWCTCTNIIWKSNHLENRQHCKKQKKLENWKILVISEDTLSRSLTIFFFDYISIISMYKYSRSQNDKDTKMTVPHFEWPPVQINVWLTSEARATKVASFSSNWKGKSFTSNFPIAHCHACFLSFNQIQSASKVVISKVVLYF